jgi:hypothetical protein
MKCGWTSDDATPIGAVDHRFKSDDGTPHRESGMLTVRSLGSELPELLAAKEVARYWHQLSGHSAPV